MKIFLPMCLLCWCEFAIRIFQPKDEKPFRSTEWHTDYTRQKPGVANRARRPAEIQPFVNPVRLINQIIPLGLSLTPKLQRRNTTAFPSNLP
jgi:hypothetical protein